MVIRDCHVLAVAGHVDVPARALGDAAVGQVALEDPRAGQGVQVLTGLEARSNQGQTCVMWAKSMRPSVVSWYRIICVQVVPERG